MARRDEWAKRIEQWTQSGLTGAEFAQQIGVKERTLRHWKWQLQKLARSQSVAPSQSRRTDFVELAGPSATSKVIAAPEPFELVLGNGLCVRIPAFFDEDALHRLIDALRKR